MGKSGLNCSYIFIIYDNEKNNNIYTNLNFIFNLNTMYYKR